MRITLESQLPNVCASSTSAHRLPAAADRASHRCAPATTTADTFAAYRAAGAGDTLALALVDPNGTADACAYAAGYDVGRALREDIVKKWCI